MRTSLKTKFKSVSAAAMLAAVACLPMTAHAGLFDDDEARKAILDLRNKVDSLQKDMANKSDKNSALSLSDQNDQLRQEIARLRGQIEVLTNELSNTQQRQKDFYVDLDARLRKLEPQKVNIDGKESSVDLNEQKSYDAALNLFKGGDYKGAGAAFNDFLKRYPQSGYAPSAQYWVGNALYAQRDYKGAIAAQQAVAKNYPDSPKVADAMLNIGSSYIELKDKAAAKKSLDALIAKYPESPAAQTGKEKLATLK
ncbi:tol-pal system protein YbgF [Herbaspirillum sp. meg3]|jgi:tol-pal system protein YbgF|uniref:tol-pal system protein YbgF n=1 Tax=Herbaspirillum sp. meg3 TaxID=2025949 RepID=UPI000B99920B|nr:tol-pal system protein YbgF [Herbaspirillum sp. meg3]ASU40018.1 tol-pal system protein YbgF [Herbaspirillum sp. meg3]